MILKNTLILKNDKVINIHWLIFIGHLYFFPENGLFRQFAHFCIYFFKYLCICTESHVWHENYLQLMGSRLRLRIRVWTQSPCIGVLATGPPGKFPHFDINILKAHLKEPFLFYGNQTVNYHYVVGKSVLLFTKLVATKRFSYA